MHSYTNDTVARMTSDAVHLTPAAMSDSSLHDIHTDSHGPAAVIHDDAPPNTPVAHPFVTLPGPLIAQSNRSNAGGANTEYIEPEQAQRSMWGAV